MQSCGSSPNYRRNAVSLCSHRLNAAAVLATAMSGWRTDSASPVYDFAFPVGISRGDADPGHCNPQQRAASLIAVVDLVLPVLRRLVIWESVRFPLLSELWMARRIHVCGMAAIAGFIAAHLLMVVLVAHSLLLMRPGRFGSCVHCRSTRRLHATAVRKAGVPPANGVAHALVIVDVPSVQASVPAPWAWDARRLRHRHRQDDGAASSDGAGARPGWATSAARVRLSLDAAHAHPAWLQESEAHQGHLREQ